MTAHDYLRVLRKRWLTILIVTLIGIAAGVALVLATTKRYTASAQIFVAASSAEGTAALNNGNTFAQARVQSYTSVATSPQVLSAAAASLLGPRLSAGQLADKISADAPLNKVLLNIHVEDTSPARSAQIANAVSAQLVTYVENIEKISAGSAESPVKLTVIHPAQVPATPTTPKTTLDLIIGLVAGLLLGLGFAALRETLDTRVRTLADVGQTTDAAVIAVVPSDRRTSANPVASRGDEYSARAEAYRQLRANLQYIRVDSPPKVIAVTSAISGEGKSTTAINLATTLADAGLTITLVDADLRRPSVAKYLGIAPGAGLTSILAGLASVEDVLQSVGPNLSVIASGPIPPNPSELVSSAHFRDLLKTLGDSADYVVVDTTPLLPVADGREVASAADISLLVTQSGRTNRDELRDAVEALARVDAKLGGIIFNMVSSRESGAYYQYYSSEKEKTRSRSAEA